MDAPVSACIDLEPMRVVSVVAAQAIKVLYFLSKSVNASY